MAQAPRNRSHRVSAATNDMAGKPLAGHRTALGLLLLAFTLSISDLFGPRYGDNSLSVSLAYFSLIGLWGSLHFWLCGRALAKQQAAKSVQSAASV